MQFNLKIKLKPKIRKFGYFTKRKNKYVIEINSNRDQLTEIQTLFHEFCHFVCYIQNYLAKPQKDTRIFYVEKKQNDEERLCERISRLAIKEFIRYYKK